MVNYTSKLVKGASIIFFTSILSSAFGYLIRVLLARKLTIEEFGLFFAVYNVVLLIGLVKGFGMGAIVPKFIPEFHANNEQDKVKSVLVFVFSFSLLLSILFLIFIYVFPAGLINDYFKSQWAKSLLLILFIFVSVDSVSKIISGFFLSRYFSFLFSLRELIFRASIVLLLFTIVEVNIFGVSFIYVAAALLGLIINLGFFFKSFSFFSYKISITKEMVGRMFKFSTPLMFRDFFITFMTKVDTLALVYFRPLAEVAIYNAILPTVELLLIFSRPFGNMLFPLSSELWALNKKEKIASLLKMVYKYVLLLSIPLGIGIYFFSKFILKTFFGAEYALGSCSLSILATGFVFGGLNIISSRVLVGIGKSMELAKVTILRNVINMGLNILLIPLFGKFFNQGYLGAAISTTFCFLLSFLIFSYYLYKYLNFLPPLKSFFYTFISGFLASTISYVFIKNILNVYLQIGSFVIVLGVCYPLFLFLFGVVSKKEIKNLFNLFSKKKSI
jgi:O-antigen/teichoic acid export membrane protein